MANSVSSEGQQRGLVFRMLHPWCADHPQLLVQVLAPGIPQPYTPLNMHHPDGPSSGEGSGLRLVACRLSRKCAPSGQGLHRAHAEAALVRLGRQPRSCGAAACHAPHQDLSAAQACFLPCKLSWFCNVLLAGLRLR